MKILGIGFRGMNIFLAEMDIPNSLYYATITKIHENSKQCSNIVIQKAVKKEIALIATACNEARNLNVSGDETWMKRGFTSLLRYGVFSKIYG